MNDILLGILILSIYFSPVFYQLVIVIRESKRGNRLPLRKLLKFFKYSLAVLIPLALGFAVISHTNYLNYESPIPYNRVDQITFENFRGLEFFKKSLYGNERFAYVMTSIETDIEEDSVRVQSYFHPSRSFVYNTHSNSEELLLHEVYHFKITELFCRKTKKAISELENAQKKDIERILDLNMVAKNAYQKKYDYDTFHSYVYGEQKKYERVIDSLLNLHSEYEPPKVVLHDKN